MKQTNEKTMTNNKQQTEINAVEYLDKVNQFAKENNTGKPKQQTAIEWLFEKMMTERHPISVWNDIVEEAIEMEKDQHIKSWEAGLMKVDFNEYYEQTYEGGEQ